MKKIIYHCYGSSHSSVTAAAIHLGMLPRNRLPTSGELLSIPHFDRTTSREVGTPFFMGTDHWGNEVYILGRGRAKKFMKNAVKSLCRIHGFPEEDLLLVDALSILNTTTVVGGTLSRGLGLVSLGRPIAALGIRLSYFNFVRLVEKIERSVRKEKEEIDSPKENK
ncbi:MAG: DUF3189 family protein [Firmicutes bacterium]|nr:DUF3189 family protein [Bacillota bacterium]